jgi:hypothetical protein
VRFEYRSIPIVLALGLLGASVSVASAGSGPAAQSIHAGQLTADTKVDGFLTDAEWSRAARVSGGDGIEFLFAANDNHYAIAVLSGAKGPHYVDVFVLQGGEIVNLHASFKVGERRLVGRDWTDSTPATAWGRTTGWTANSVRKRKDVKPETDFARSLEPYQGYEFVLDKSKYGAGPLHVRIEARDFLGQKADVVFPAGSSRFDPTSWAVVVSAPN